MTIQKIPLAEPALIGNERAYVNSCLEDNWISSSGQYVERFEKAFAEYCNVKHGLSCSNGTVALHLALLALGVNPGDEVIVPSLTYVATANAVTYCGAKPVFIDSEEVTWNLDPTLIEGLITKNTKGIIVVHLYGNPVEMDPVLRIASRYGLFVIEDAAEAHGAEYKGRRVGSIGDISTFSFYGNKIITTGEGGMVLTNNDQLADLIRKLKGQGFDPNRRYYFPIVGYNYRMTNVAAAIGLAQVENIDWHIRRRYEIAMRYMHRLKELPGLSFQDEKPWTKNVYWMTSIVIGDQHLIDRDDFMAHLANRGIETRPFFYPVHLLPMYQNQLEDNQKPVAQKLAARGVNLPSYAKLTDENIDYICDQIFEILS